MRTKTIKFFSAFFFLTFALTLPAFANHAKADILDPSGNKIGEVVLTQAAEGVTIALDVQKLTPGEHAMHIHAVGKCEGPDFASAGPHFNPAHKQHGVHNPNGAHAGDLPNLVASEEGTIKTEVTTNGVTLEEGVENSLFGAEGTAVIIHAGPDDNVTDPAGNAGGRIACGVIQKLE